VVTFSPAPNATSIVDGPLTVACSPASGSTFPVGKTVVSCSATDSYGQKSTKTFDVTVPDAADVEIVKKASASSVIVGGTLTYTLTVTNHGPSDATNMSINDPLPAGFTVNVALSSPE